MSSETPSQPLLNEQILRDARQQAEARLARARAEAERSNERAMAEAAAWRAVELAKGRSEAERRRELVVGVVPLERKRRRLVRLDALLLAIQAEARQKLTPSEPAALRAMLLALSVEAARPFDGAPLVVKLSAEEQQSCGAELERALALRLGRAREAIEVVAGDAQTGSGPIVEERGGRRVWDNRLAARLERLWPELRRKLARQLFTEATGELP